MSKLLIHPIGTFIPYIKNSKLKLLKRIHEESVDSGNEDDYCIVPLQKRIKEDTQTRSYIVTRSEMMSFFALLGNNNLN